MYAQPIHPPNLWMERDPGGTPRSTTSTAANIARLLERGTFTPPAHDFPGSRYYPGSDDPADAEWSRVRELWAGDD